MIHDDNMTISTQANEQLLLLADEGISKIKQELLRKKAPPLGRVEERPKPPQLKSNFNLSFNNSFNTSIAANQNKPTMAVHAESQLNGEIIKHQIIADLEEKLTNRLGANDSQA